MSKLTLHAPAKYEIVVKGHISANWADHFEMGATRSLDADSMPVTILTGEVIDQAQLVGILDILYSSGAPIISVRYLGETG